MPRRFPSIPTSVLTDLYVPEFVPTQEKLQNMIDNPDAVSKQARQKIDQQVAEAEETIFSGAPTPITKEEALAVEERVQELREGIATTRQRIAQFKSQIDEQAGLGTSGNELSFKIDITKKRALKRALKKAFGIKTDTLSYSMYKTALAAKKQLEQEDADEYTSGSWSRENGGEE